MIADPSSCSNFHEIVITHIDLDWDVDFESKRIAGSAELHVNALKRTDKLVLDGNQLVLKGFSHDDKPLNFSVDKNDLFGEKITVDIGAIDEGQERKIKVQYTTGESASALQFLDKELTKDKELPFLFSQCQSIHARSIVPCMDTPGIKQSYSAKVSVPSLFTCLMSAVGEGSEVNGDKTTYTFKQPVPIPAYLLAIVAGRLEKKVISDRCAVWAEPSVVDSAAYEFADTEKMLKAAEDLAGPYVWGRYDLVVLPPSFPFGGMENPCLTFVTPSLLAGDRSLANVVAHEIAHSWTGNLVTNATWEHFWLNEGFTVFLERKIMGRLYGEGHRQFAALTGYEDNLLPCIHDQFNPCHPYTKLITDLKNVDPDDSYSVVPYEKGSAFLMYIEQQIGSNERFEQFLKAYLAKFKYQAVTTDMWKACLEEFFADKKAVLDNIDFHKWLNDPGVPPNKPQYDETLVEACRKLAKKWVDGSDADVNAITKDDFTTMTSAEKVKVLQCIRTAGPLSTYKLEALDRTYSLLSSRNCEIKFAWLQIAVKARWSQVLPAALQFVTTYGRLKYLRPLYRNLFSWPEARNQAIAQFQQNIPSMHPISVQVIKRLM
ncbi:hypothetical protein QR680_017213 [Steinernema hermaphroditum]|uniref:Peptidase M1 leukotriene A4 hydrolase/aminopeptidase C-terminal domain-containing protein n=1 Tax=Steinernema hermaphroditum TaxID=289476 RepID=A0AA39LNY8_9BILA|nr:hypothetical protein QR680_017213 [Steinernema hermaphroditum]